MYGLGTEALGGLFALSAGLLLFVATGALMAPLKEVAPTRGFIALVSGVAIAVVLLNLPFVSHDHDHAHPEAVSYDHDHSEHEHAGHDRPRMK